MESQFHHNIGIALIVLCWRAEEEEEEGGKFFIRIAKNGNA